MKERILLGVSAFFACLLIVSVAFAALPTCSSSSPRGQVCASGTDVKTSCGNGKFLNGAVRNAGNLEDGCFALSNTTTGTKDKAPVRNEKKSR